MRSILGEIGTAVPEHRSSQTEIKELAKTFSASDARNERFIDGIYARSGVANRHSVLFNSPTGTIFERQQFYSTANCAEDRGPSTAERMQIYQEQALLLARKSCTDALNKSNCRADQITHLVTASCTGFVAPGFDLGLIDELNIDRQVARTHVGFMGCHAALNALRVADSFAENPDARVLVCATELCSLHFQYGAVADQAIANSLFADGSAAVVIQKAATSESGWRITSNASTVIPNSAQHMSWSIGDNGFEMSLSTSVPSIIHETASPWLTEWLASHQLDIEDIESWAVHPGGPKIISAFADAVGLRDEAVQASREILAEYGNMSSPTILFVIDRLRQMKATLPCVAIAFGPGLTIEAMLLT